MKRILALTISALLLSGCIAEWKNPNGPQRDWSGSSGQPMTDNTGRAATGSGP